MEKRPSESPDGDDTITPGQPPNKRGSKSKETGESKRVRTSRDGAGSSAHKLSPFPTSLPLPKSKKRV